MSEDKITLVLVDAADTYNFRAGLPMVLVDGSGFQLRPATRLKRLGLWLRDRWLSATRWFRPRTVCSAIDHEAGMITMVTERWSWRRRRWERAA